METVGALIVATGKAGSNTAFDPMKQVGALSAVERLALVFKTAGVARVVIVEDEGQKIQRHTGRLGVVCLQLENGQKAEMLDAVKLGLRYLQDKCARVLVTPVDVPLFSASTVHALAEQAADVAIPSHGKQSGHPVALSAAMFGAVLAYSGGGGLAGAIRKAGVAPVYVDVQDAGVLLDVRKQDEYEQILQNQSLNELRFEQKLSISKEKPFFGPGPCFLLKLVEETGSLRMACTQMGISYSKGWRIVENIESQLGRPVLERKRGGVTRGQSKLTPDGARLLAAYGDFCTRCEAAAQAAFADCFSAFL